MDAFPQSSTSENVRKVQAYEVTETASGLITVRWNRTATIEESQELMALLARYWAAGRHYACAMITHPDVDADARHRRLWGEWHEAHRHEINRYCRGTAITSDSATVRTLMTVMSWFSKDGYPIKFVATEREARAWAASRLLEM